MGFPGLRCGEYKARCHDLGFCDGGNGLFLKFHNDISSGFGVSLPRQSALHGLTDLRYTVPLSMNNSIERVARIN